MKWCNGEELKLYVLVFYCLGGITSGFGSFGSYIINVLLLMLVTCDMIPYVASFINACPALE